MRLVILFFIKNHFLGIEKGEIGKGHELLYMLVCAGNGYIASATSYSTVICKPRKERHVYIKRRRRAKKCV